MRKHLDLAILLFVAGAAEPALAQHEGHQQPDAKAHDHATEMTGFFGPYPMGREASGTSWQPESTPSAGYHFMKGRWMLMLHALGDVVYDRQGGPRGETELYGPTMGMLMASRPAGRGTLGLRAMLSLDPATIGRGGYPLLLQTGETSDGSTHLVDRQHPHDLFMELAASYSVPFAEHGSVFGYVGMPGEPALGPPAFMHRFSGLTLPEAPITHHWIDSTHISFGVATLGVGWRRLRLEASSFTGREPDHRRWNFDTPRFDSFSGRLSVSPTKDWALQISAGHLNSPEQLEPEVDVDRWTASVSYNRPLNGGASWQTTAAWGRNRKQSHGQDAVLLESTWWSGNRHSVFARAETVEKNELFEGPRAREEFQVAKLSAGYVYDFSRVGRLSLGVGGLGSVYRIPRALERDYGGAPVSFMLLVRGVLR